MDSAEPKQARYRRSSSMNTALKNINASTMNHIKELEDFLHDKSDNATKNAAGSNMTRASVISPGVDQDWGHQNKLFINNIYKVITTYDENMRQVRLYKINSYS